jgi:GNAT superfamily N-acetyltransferase
VKEMPFDHIIQPKLINITEHLRLRKFDDNYSFAYSWYQDENTVKLVDGVSTKYDYDTLTKMYNYLNDRGELYFIEVYNGQKFIPIGDVTFCRDDLPIVIGDENYRNKGIGKLVIDALIQRAKQLDFNCIKVREVYDFNIGSKRLFESMGFKKYTKTNLGYSYIYNIKSI